MTKLQPTRRCGISAPTLFAFLLTAVIAAFAAPSAQATLLEIELGGVNIGFDGDDIFDDGAFDPDTLNSVAFLVDGSMVGSVLTTDITLDLFIPDVPAIADTGAIVVSAPGGFFNLGLPGADFLDLDLGAATVTYIDLTTVQFSFGGSVAAIAGQSLPFGLVIGEPVSVSFSTQILPGTLVTAGGFVEEFSASGTGEIRGVPEPASIVLAAAGAFALAGIVWRRRRTS
ncbi:MAG: PEP-CTERM sorting domain-containing protein [Planctomycetota bacterium]|nr:MAG: PEP-CTERM sorting domain-containing protein [Planctomycetota bacterium]